MTDFCWLIEAPGPNYLTAEEWQLRRKFAWTPAPQLALRFHSKAQADNTMMAIRHLVPELFAFASCLGIDASPVEHGFAPAGEGEIDEAKNHKPTRSK